jgi:hypothetical protein
MAVALVAIVSAVGPAAYAQAVTLHDAPAAMADSALSIQPGPVPREQEVQIREIG